MIIDTSKRADRSPPSTASDKGIEDTAQRIQLRRIEGLAAQEAALAPGESRAEAARPAGRGGGMPAPVQGKMEAAFGSDFSNVRIHQSSEQATQLKAQAFTRGNDLHFAPGAYDPGSPSGQELLGHELAHVVQQREGRVQPTAQLYGEGANPAATAINDSPALEHEADAMAARATRHDGASGGEGEVGGEISNPVVQGKFVPGTATASLNLRQADRWNHDHGPRIARGTELLVDDNDGNNKTQNKIFGNETWRPAINVRPTELGQIPDNKKGYIRDSSVAVGGSTFRQIVELRVEGILALAETRRPGLAGHLNKDVNVQFLVDRALRFPTWGESELNAFAAGFDIKEERFARIEEGANYVADSLDHWRRWLHPTRAGEVVITDVRFLQSDLHERGLGVMSVSFTKPEGPEGHKFAADTNVDVMIKPEDKSLEENLLGDKPDSAVNRINTIVGLTDKNEILRSIRMACTETHGSLVEKVKGVAAEDLGEGDARHVHPAFHETLVFAFLAGLDDLHKENVFWHKGRPYLIDADNVLSYNQMRKQDNGALNQSGFGANYDNAAATANKDAITTNNNTVGSRLLQTMLEEKGRAIEILDVIKGAITGKNGRVVPIKTGFWGSMLAGYSRMPGPQKETTVNQAASSGFLVREATGFNDAFGPGLYGTCKKNELDPFYDEAGERLALRNDFDAGVIPFYNYEYDSGHVFHNGTKIYHGQTLEQAMQLMMQKFNLVPHG